MPNSERRGPPWRDVGCVRHAPKWNPGEYAKHSAAQLAWARELFARLKLKGDESLLDIGSGDGKVTAGIAAALPRGRVVGLDGSHEMVEPRTRMSTPRGERAN